MKKLNKKDLKQPGRFMMLYGETGVGKTTSIVQSALEPICYIQTEPRSLKPSLDAAGRPDLDIDVCLYESFSDLMEFVSKTDNFERYQSVVVDSFSHLMNVDLSAEITDESFDARSEKEKKNKPLVSRVKMSVEGYGGLSANMFRLTAALGRISRLGKCVVVTALLVENPRYNRELSAAPSLKGREYPANMPGFFDLIGLVQTRTDGEGNVVYPIPGWEFFVEVYRERKPN
jgi:hypothetical protein